MDYLVVNIKSKDRRQEQEFKEVTVLENSACDKRLVQAKPTRTLGGKKNRKAHSLQLQLLVQSF